jgi:hypothetical protein
VLIEKRRVKEEAFAEETFEYTETPVMLSVASSFCVSPSHTSGVRDKKDGLADQAEADKVVPLPLSLGPQWPELPKLDSYYTPFVLI